MVSDDEYIPRGEKYFSGNFFWGIVFVKNIYYLCRYSFNVKLKIITMATSWKTTTTGIITIVGAVCTFIAIFASAFPVAAVVGLATAVVAGIGQILGKDADDPKTV
jgi:hypothetical protein